ncbi:hypothetical protein [Labilibaculum euxinus]
MALEKELRLQSIVLVAENFNPSLFNRTWLVKHGFVDDDSILDNSIFTPQITNLITDKFNLLVIPNQLQFLINNNDTSFKDFIGKTLIPIIQKLGDGIPYKAVGVNFNWYVEDNSKNISFTSRELFYNESIKISKEFDCEDARFGNYMSMNYEGARLKLDMKPVNAFDQRTKKTWECLLCIFNFHTELTTHDSDNVLNVISKWELYREKSEELIKLL